jgi:hypothetical protein
MSQIQNKSTFKALGSFGYQISMYLDDGWASHDEYTCLVSKKMQKDLKNAEFVVNNENNIWEPTDRFEWLGFIWDLGKLQQSSSQKVILQKHQTLYTRYNFKKT